MIDYWTLSFLMRPSPSFEWVPCRKFDLDGFAYNHVHPDFRSGFRTLMFVSEETIRRSEPDLLAVILVQENALRYHRHLFPDLCG